jgi:hypothetical protein
VWKKDRNKVTQRRGRKKQRKKLTKEGGRDEMRQKKEIGL